jgi:hypothetical protein
MSFLFLRKQFGVPLVAPIGGKSFASRDTAPHHISIGHIIYSLLEEIHK